LGRHGLAPVSLADFKGKVKIISAVPSSTPTCDTETRRFNQEAAKLRGTSSSSRSASPPVRTETVVRGGRHRQGEDPLGLPGPFLRLRLRVLIKELRLLSRSIFVVDGSDTVRYVQHVKEVAPGADAAVLAAARGLT
jgi:thiol peroxidase